MLRLTSILLALLYAVAFFRFSVWRTKRELDARSSELADPVLLEQSMRLARALDLPRVRVFIYEVDPVNGLAAPDGRIFITRGFYDRFRSGEVSAEEMASVIAHELGHVALGHARRRMIDFAGQNAARAAITMILARIIPGIGGWIAGGLMRLLAAGLSRRDEFEADEYASALLIKAGIGVAPQISLFDKLEHLTGGPGGTPAWLMSHPKTTARVDAIRANEAKWLG